MVVKTPDYRALAEKARTQQKRKSKPAGQRRKKATPNVSAENVPPPPHDEESTRAYLIAQEIKFAKVFAGNDTKVSEKQLKRLRRWLKIRSASSFPFERSNFMRIWKGLFYSMWMSDKPLPQEQLAEGIAQLLHAFDAPQVAVEFFGAFLQTMCAEWFGIDQWRIDKFMMLVRRVARQMLVRLHATGWSVELLQQLNAQLTTTVLRNSSVGSCIGGSGSAVGFFMHFTELWLEEVAKVSDGEVAAEAVTELLRPFGAYLARSRDGKLCKHVCKHVFNYLLFQSELGREYQERFEAWKGAGFPGNTIEAMEKFEEETDDEEVEEVDDEEAENGAAEEEADDGDDDEYEDVDDEDGETGEKHLDPRAGRVDVVMAEIKFDANQIIEFLAEERQKPYANVKSRQQIARVIDNYTVYASGKFPLGIQSVKLKSDVIELPRVDDKVNEMVLFEKKLRKQNDALRHLSKRNRKKVLAGKPIPETARKRRAPLDEHELDAHVQAAPHAHRHAANGSCCGGGPSPAKRRTSLPAALKEKINQWAEEDIEIVPAPQNGVQPNGGFDEESAAPTTKSPKVAAVKATAKKSPPKPVDPWDEPLQDGEIEYSTPSRKQKLAQLQRANGVAAAAEPPTPDGRKVLNPAAIALLRQQTPGATTPSSSAKANGSTPSTAERKRVKIMLQMNRSQEKSEYFQQLRNSPQTPYDASRVPPKGVLKPNLMPSPINPYYQKKIGLSFD